MWTASLAPWVLAAAAAAGPCAGVAGRYGSGDGFVSTGMSIEADCRATLSLASDDGTMWKVPAVVTVAGCSLRVRGEGVPAEARVPASFELIRWGPRVYLAPADRALAFCNAVNGGMEPSRGYWTLLRRGDERKRPEGLPEVPTEWRDFVLAAPLTGKVTRVEREERSETVSEGECTNRVKVQSALVRVDLGSDHGLRRGMVLYASSSRRPSLYGELRVLEAAASESLAEVELQYVARVKKGDSVSTRRLR